MLRLEAWTLPASGSFTKVVSPIPYKALLCNPKFNGVGVGSFTVSQDYARLKDILDPDNNLETLIRVFDGETEVYSFFARVSEEDSKVEGNVVVSGPGIESELDNARVYPFDWAGSPQFPASSVTGESTFADTIYGGVNLLANPGWEGSLTNEVQEMQHDYRPVSTLNGAIDDTQTTLVVADGSIYPASDFRIQVDFELMHVTSRSGNTFSGLTRGLLGTFATSHSHGTDVEGGGWFTLTYSGQTTSRLEWNAFPSEIKSALEFLSNVVEVDVDGSGTADDPWLVEFVDPGEDDLVLMTANVTNMVSGTSFSITENLKGGNGRVEPWTKSFNPNSKNEHGDYAVFEVGSASLTGAPTFEGDKALKIEVEAGNYPGYQQIVPVQPGGTYQAKARVYPTAADMSFAIVVRDLNENLIAKVNYWQQPINTWSELQLVDVIIPENIKHVMFRVAAIQPNDAEVWWGDGNEFNEGMPPDTAGQIVLNLQSAATAESRTILTWLDTSSFTGAIDSKSVVWDKNVSMYISAGSSWLDVLEELTRHGYEWEIKWNGSSYALNIYNPGGMGTTVTDKQLSPHRIDEAFIRSQSPAHNVLLGEGADGKVDEVLDASLVAAYGRREGFISDFDALDAAALTSVLTHGLNERIASKKTAKFTVDDTLKLGVNINIGDTITVDYPNKIAKAGYRIRGAMVVVDLKGNVIRTVDIGKYVHREVMGGTTSSITSEAVNFLLRQRRQIQRVQSALADVTNLTAVPSDSVSRPIIVAGAATGADVKAVASYVCDGVDDNVEIAAALAAAMAEQSRVVYLAGTFTVSATVVVPAFGSLRGLASSDGSIVFGTSGLSHVIELSTRADLRDVQVSPAGNGDAVRYTLFSSWQRIIRCHLKGAGTGAALRAPNGVNRAQLLDSRLENATLSDPLIVLAENVQDWTMDGCRLDGGSYGVDVVPGASAPGRIVVHRNRFVGCGYGGIRIAGNGAPYVQIIDNHLTGLGDESAGATVDAAIKLTGTAAADWEAASTEEYGTIVRGNIIEVVTVGHGIILEDVDGAIVDGNYIEDTNRHGIWLDGATEATVIGNVLWSNGVETPSGTYDHMRITGGGRHRLVANRARIRAGGSVHAGYGLHVESGAVDVYVDDSNDFSDGGTTGDVLIAGTATGLTGAGSSSIADTASSVSIAHNLPYTPTSVVVSPDGNELLWVTNIGASTFDVNRAGTSGVRNFGWAAR